MPLISKKNENQKAFTLIELSMVIVIVGLIVGAISASQVLIIQARLRGVMADVTKYTSAFITFKGQYVAIPGDLATAQNFWAASFNGNGNNLINSIALNSTPWEDLYAWNQLYHSGLVSGFYTGAYAAPRSVVGTNFPASSLANGSGYGMYSWVAADGIVGGAARGNLIQLATVYATTGLVENAAISPRNAYAIDVKVDDGLPGAGAVYTLRGSSLDATVTACTNATAAATTAATTYFLIDSTTSCRMAFIIEKG